MAKRSGSTLNNQSGVTHEIIPPQESIPFEEVHEELGIDPTPKVTYNKVTKRVVNAYPSRIIRIVNGTRYEWRPGETIEVKSEDTDALRNLTMGDRPCCGHSPSIILQVLED